MAVDYVQNYVRHISDVSSPKPEYVRHFEASSPRALGGCYVLPGASSSSPTFAKIEAWHSTKIDGGLKFVDHEVQQTIENMVESLVLANECMDKFSNHDLGVDVHDVPGDGDCVLHHKRKQFRCNTDGARKCSEQGSHQGKCR